MVNNNLIQEMLVARLKSDPTLLNLLTVNNREIRENQWQGVDFVYPCIRVDLQSQTPVPGCNLSNAVAVILCYSENESSREVNNIAWEVCNFLHNHPFVYNSLRVSSILVTELGGAIREGDLVWRADVRLEMLIAS